MEMPIETTDAAALLSLFEIDARDFKHTKELKK